MMTFHPYQAEPKCKHIFMICIFCVKIPLDAGGVDTRTYCQVFNETHGILFPLHDFYNERKPSILNIKKMRVCIFSYDCTEISKVIFLWYFNEVIFER